MSAERQQPCRSPSAA